jgi:sulfur carrier protein ThiS
MHRGSSNGVRRQRRAPETLPLSASPTPVLVTIEITRGGSVERTQIRVAPGTLIRAALRSTGHAPEGSAVLIEEVPVPLDTPIDQPVRLTVVPTFSGG